MPVCELNTNISIPNKKEVATTLSKLVAELLGKPESVMVVKVIDDCALCFGGTFEPAYVASIYSIGKISPELNVNTSAGVSQYLSKELGLPDDRGYIMFFDKERSNFGYKGKTF